METIFSADNKPVKNYIAFFDLDLTITRSISGKALARAAFRKKLLTRTDLISAIFLSFAFRLKLRDPRKIIDKMVSWVRGIPEETIIDLCSGVFKEVLLPSVYKEAIAEIEFHKAKNARVVLLSSALTTVCEEMAANLKLDDIICSGLEVRNGIMTGRPLGHLCFGEEKAIRLLAYCEKSKSPPADAWYYSDSFSDISALNSVGHPVCVNPDNRLKRTAVVRNWKILRWTT